MSEMAKVELRTIAFNTTTLAHRCRRGGVHTIKVVKDGKMLLEPIELPGENPSREAEMLAAIGRSRK
jgi:hypothetical protein